MSKLFLGMLLTVAGVATGAVASEKSWDEKHGAAGLKHLAPNTTAGDSPECAQAVVAIKDVFKMPDESERFEMLMGICLSLSPETLKEIEAKYALRMVAEETPYKLKADGFHKYHQRLELVQRPNPGAPVLGEMLLNLSAFVGVSPSTQATPVIQPQESQAELRGQFLTNIKNKCRSSKSMDFAGKGLSDLPSFQDVRAIKDEKSYSAYWSCCLQRIKVDFSNNNLQGVPGVLGLFLCPTSDHINLENNKIADKAVLEHTLSEFLQVRDGCKKVATLRSLSIYLGGNPITQTYQTVQDLPLSQALRDKMRNLNVTLQF